MTGPPFGGTSLAAYSTLREPEGETPSGYSPVPYYNEDRPHRMLGSQTPEAKLRPVTGPIRSRPVLNGMHHVYERAA